MVNGIDERPAARAPRDLAVSHHAGVLGTFRGDSSCAGGSTRFAFGTPLRCASGRAPLAVVFEHTGKAVRWDLGPYRDGRWRLVLGEGVQVVEVPRRGGFHLPGARLLSLRVRYQAPSGWVTYSPPLTVDFARAKRQRWARHGEQSKGRPP